MKRALITGSSGLVGSEAVAFFEQRGFEVHGVDNNMRRSFFGPDGDTAWNLARFFAHESCGQCTPCREGTTWMMNMMNRFVEGRGHQREIDMLLELTCVQLDTSYP